MNADIRWVGHRRTETGGTFFPVSTQPPNAFPPESGSPWATNEPDEIDQCLATEPVGMGVLKAENCDSMLDYICECDTFAPSTGL